MLSVAGPIIQHHRERDDQKMENEFFQEYNIDNEEDFVEPEGSYAIYLYLKYGPTNSEEKKFLLYHFNEFRTNETIHIELMFFTFAT